MKNCFRNLNLYFISLVALFFLFGFGAHCQNAIQHSDTSIERLVKVGNHKLFIREKGNSDARFTVVFESGGGGSSQDWAKVIAVLPSEIRTVAYDRAGIGKSEKRTITANNGPECFRIT